MGLKVLFGEEKSLRINSIPLTEVMIELTEEYDGWALIISNGQIIGVEDKL